MSGLVNLIHRYECTQMWRAIIFDVTAPFLIGLMFAAGGGPGNHRSCASGIMPNKTGWAIISELWYSSANERANLPAR
jgi:hypothetical protein